MSQDYLDIDIKGIEGLKKKLRKLGDKAPTAMYRAINDAAKKARTEMDRNTRAEYFMKRKFILETLKIDKAHKGKLSAFIRSRGGAIPLSEFKTNPTKPSPGRRLPIKARVRRNGAAKPLEGKIKGESPKAFIATFNGEKAVVERKSADRGPLDTLFGPAVPSVMKNEKVISGVNEEAKKKLVQRLDHHIEHLLKN